MKLLRVIASMNPENGGPCQGLRNSIPELHKQGVECDVVSLDDPEESFLANDTFSTIALGPSKTAWCYSNKLLPWLYENLHHYDVVIIHGLWQYHGFAVYKAIRKLGRRKQSVPRLYVMPHGMLDPYFQKASGRKLKAVRNSVYWKLIESEIINNADGVLFTCKAELLLARETFNSYLPNQELNVGYGIEVPPAFKAEMKQSLNEICPVATDNKFILFLSRIHEKKGVDLLIRAYSEMYKLNSKLPFLLIAGPGLESEYGQSLKKMVSEDENLINKIYFTGMLSGYTKWGAFYGCEAFILPSHQENFGIAVVEALACGKPVLISDQVNIYNEIEGSNAGIVSKDTLAGVIELLNRWMHVTRTEKNKMSDLALQSYKDNFAIQSATRLLISSIV